MRKLDSYEFEIDSVGLGMLGDDEDYVSLDEMTDKELEVYAKRMGCTRELLVEIDDQFRNFKDALRQDLLDIINRKV